ncbi:hypothetical protein GURASL_32520 [Geotalea uraniireducens]|uniref:Uncharacterized protein n=1 Tax=Geotalea uraniireducens TaxID=351604 RepID=A0ABM8ENZ1_9BACT|nr:hypothetical protein [Geotalea uraniireducens]BDV44329.1 hypothetical protein GURASL_32520 [Geotalea uraniireducens]
MKRRTPYLFSAAILLLAFLSCWALDSYGRSARVYNRAGRLNDPAVARVVVTSPQEACLFWKERGYRGRRLVFIGDRWARFDPSQYNEAPLYRGYPFKLYNLAAKQTREDLDAENFLYIAALNGIVREITAILSPNGFAELAAEARAARNVRFGRHGIFLSHQGFPRTFTTASRFQAGTEPVLLYVSAASFRERDPDELYRRLLQSGLTTDCIVLCLQDGDPAVSPAERAKLARFAELLGAGAKP